VLCFVLGLVGMVEAHPPAYTERAALARCVCTHTHTEPPCVWRVARTHAHRHTRTQPFFRSPSNPNKTHTRNPCCQFSALLRHDLVKDLVALYDPAARRMSYIIQLGEEVRTRGKRVAWVPTCNVFLQLTNHAPARLSSPPPYHHHQKPTFISPLLMRPLSPPSRQSFCNTPLYSQRK
jgi:hypothetical protein